MLFQTNLTHIRMIFVSIGNIVGFGRLGLEYCPAYLLIYTARQRIAVRIESLCFMYGYYWFSISSMRFTSVNRPKAVVSSNPPAS